MVTACTLLLAMTAPAGAVRPAGVAPRTGVLEVKRGPSVRAEVQVTAGRAPASRRAAWSRFARSAGQSWRATWDRATAVPRQLWGDGIPAPGSVASADTAAFTARAMLAAHIELLAPGAEIADFVLVANRVDNGLRVVGFAQHHQGVPVIGGQVSFRFKNDRLLLIASQALPDVSLDVATSAAAIAPYQAEIISTGWVLSDVATTASVREVGEPVILPLIGDGGVQRYALVRPVTVDATGPLGRWDVYVDATTGEQVARTQTLMFGAGSVLYNAPVRYPLSERADFPARDTSTFIDGFDILTDTGGVITWQGSAPAQLTTKTAGLFVDVRNQAGSDDIEQFTIADGGQVVWDARTAELIDAQVSSFVHAREVKDYTRSFAPNLDFLDEIQIVNVNIDQQCNAFSDGTTINFFQASTQCANTARLADVVYHEFGHSLHAHSIIAGVGQFNGAHSEGLSDYLAATMTDDPAMGRGFFLTDAPLRHIDPTDKEHRWPIDLGGVHFTGLIFSGAMWDLRKLLIQRLGPVQGVALADRLFYATLQRATDIPSTYLEVLVEDDDDGSLTNGTPNLCDINAAFGLHGLRQLDVAVSPLARELPDEGGHPISVTVGGLFPQCPGDVVAEVVVRWRTPELEELEKVALTENNGAFEGVLPAVPDGTTVLYRLDVTLADATELQFPDNPADPLYQFYVGEVVELYCTDFEEDPFTAGWTHGLSSGSSGPGADDWSWGSPRSPIASGDPPAAFSGERVIGNDLGGSSGDGDGLYQPSKINFALSPIIAVDNYTDVHLQFRRWLNVEDGFFDDATIFVNNALAWSNFDSQQGGGSTIHHADSEWRFVDLPISSFARDKAVQVKFEISSDPGLEFGGWTIDDFCVVANVNSICGDGVLTGAEQCDDATGNSDSTADTCRTDCRLPACGDGVLDSPEECDDGNLENLDDCTTACKIPGRGGGCGCQGGGGSSALGGLAVLLFLGLRRRRRDQPCA